MGQGTCAHACSPHSEPWLDSVRCIGTSDEDEKAQDMASILRDSNASIRNCSQEAVGSHEEL